MPDDSEITETIIGLMFGDLRNPNPAPSF